VRGNSDGRKHFVTKQPGRMYALIGIATTTLAIVHLSVLNNYLYFIKPYLGNVLSL
jgi:hypothetical protein